MTVPWSVARFVRIASKNVPKMEPLASEPIWLIVTMIESDILPTKNEKKIQTAPQNTRTEWQYRKTLANDTRVSVSFYFRDGYVYQVR